MNGVHDMGGMDGFGKVEPEANEPTFHQDWEARVMAMVRVMGANGGLGIDSQRFARESLPPDFGNAADWWKPLLDTLAMSIAGTAVAVALSLPLAFLAARNTSPHPVVFQLARILLNALRSAAVRRPAGVERSATTSACWMSTPMTRWPSATSRSTTAAPMPEADPVTA